MCDIHNRVLWARSMYIVAVSALGTPSSCPDHDAFITNNCLRLDYLDVSQPRVRRALFMQVTLFASANHEFKNALLTKHWGPCGTEFCTPK